MFHYKTRLMPFAGWSVQCIRPIIAREPTTVTKRALLQWKILPDAAFLTGRQLTHPPTPPEGKYLPGLNTLKWNTRPDLSAVCLGVKILLAMWRPPRSERTTTDPFRRNFYPLSEGWGIRDLCLEDMKVLLNLFVFVTLQQKGIHSRWTLSSCDGGEFPIFISRERTTRNATIYSSRNESLPLADGWKYRRPSLSSLGVSLICTT